MGKSSADRVRTLLARLDSVRSSQERGSSVLRKSNSLSNKFIGQVERIFKNLPNPMEWLSFLNNGLPLLIDFCEEVQEVSTQLSLTQLRLDPECKWTEAVLAQKLGVIQQTINSWISDIRPRHRASRKRASEIIGNTNFGNIDNLLSQGRDVEYIARHYHMDLALASLLPSSGFRIPEFRRIRNSPAREQWRAKRTTRISSRLRQLPMMFLFICCQSSDIVFHLPLRTLPAKPQRTFINFNHGLYPLDIMYIFDFCV